MMDSHLHYDLHRDSSIKELEIIMRNENIDKGILYLIEDDVIEKGIIDTEFGRKIIPGVAINPLNDTAKSELDYLKSKGIKIVKFLPYEHKLYYEHYDKIVEFAMQIQQYNMILTICCAYGSKDVFKTNGVELAAEILRAGFEQPMILAHGGMVKQLEVHSLLREYSNLYIDLSFSIPYWWGSHVIDDIFFTIEKNDYNRIFWGSDYPYCSYQDSKKYFDIFCNRYEISTKNKDKIVRTNFEQFYKNYLK